MQEILEKLFFGKPEYHLQGDEVEVKREIRTRTDEFYPKTIEEINEMVMPDKLKFIAIPTKFYNKKFTVGDYTIHFQNREVIEPFKINFSEVTDEWKYDKSARYIYDKSKCTEEEWCVILEFHGAVKKIGSVRIYEYLNAEYMNNRRFGNWWKKAEDYRDDQRCIPTNYYCQLNLEQY